MVVGLDNMRLLFAGRHQALACRAEVDGCLSRGSNRPRELLRHPGAQQHRQVLLLQPKTTHGASHCLAFYSGELPVSKLWPFYAACACVCVCVYVWLCDVSVCMCMCMCVCAIVWCVCPYKNSHEFLISHENLMRFSWENDILMRIFQFSWESLTRFFAHENLIFLMRTESS